MFQNYEDTKTAIEERIDYVVIFSNGSLTLDRAWAMSSKELARYEKTLADYIKISMASKMI